VDEAYLEYVDDPAFADSLSLLPEFPNLIVTRTFSKAYGLAGLRIGYAIASEKNTNELKKNRIPFSLNYLAEEAAVAALEDEDFIRRSVQANAEQRRYLYNKLSQGGFHTIPSQANFIYLWFERDLEKKLIYDKLYAEGIVVCDMRIFGKDKSLRITVPDHKVCEQIVQIVTRQNGGEFQ
jgi:histidinol-phosphate aminotransferase